MKNFVMPMITDKSLHPVYVYTVGGVENQKPIDRQNGYSEFIWLHTVQGKGKIILDGTAYTMKADMGMLIYPGVAHQYYALEEPWETHWVAFHGFGVHSLLKLTRMTRSQVYALSNSRLLERHIRDIYSAATIHNVDVGLKTSGKLYSFLIDLPNCVTDDRARAHSSAGSLMKQALEYMERHYGSSFSLDDMAETIGISHQYVCRIFNQTMQMTPGAYLTKLRLQKAKELLLRKNLSIAETGKKAGFHDSSYFCYLFRQHEGVTPSEFRRKFR